MAGTALWYLASSQWRYDTFKADEFATPLGKGLLSGKHLADCLAISARLGWLPSSPAFNRNPLEITAEAEAEGVSPQEYVVRELKEGRLRFAAEDPDAPENFPRVLTLWRCNLLGVPDAAIRAEESPEGMRPEEVTWRESPEGKLDLLTTIDFRKNGSSLYSDIVLPTATWYEKHDISSTDMHPFIHPFNPAITPPWEAKSDWDIFNYIAEAFSGLAKTHLGVRKDILAVPLMHDTPDDLAQSSGLVLDWKQGECEPIPGKTMPKLVVIERDYGAVAEKMQALGPAVENVGIQAKGNVWKPAQEVEYLKRRNGTVSLGVGAGRPELKRAEQVCETILALSGTTNGRISVEGFRQLERRTGVKLADLAEEREEELITFNDIVSQPRKVIVSPEWSGTESRTRRYSPFTINVDRQVPWRTLIGRQQFYVDHEWMLEYGEGLPAYRPPMRMAKHTGDIREGNGRAEVVLKYLTPHSKWSIHSEFQDNLTMLTLFRGGPTMWISDKDAAKMGVKDNDWIEAYNRNGVVSARAVVSHRIPEGTTIMYHSQDRHLNVPISEISGARGGTENSLTKIYVKPTHMIGGYAQFSYGFNYYGPTGSQRDELTVMRKRESEVVY